VELDDLKVGRNDIYRGVIIAKLITEYPTHTIWTKLEHSCPEELVALENALQATLGAIAPEGPELGVRLAQFLDNCPNYEYAVRKWISLLHPVTMIAATVDLCDASEKPLIDRVLIAAKMDSKFVTSKTIIGRNCFNISRAILKYLRDGHVALRSWKI